MRNLAGKVAFVTGGASGIGLGMARNFLSEGMKVVIADVNDAHLAEAKALLAGSNAVHFIKVDVSDRDQLRAAAKEALAVFGKIHVLCNNAGVVGTTEADDPDFADWDRVMGINLGGVINGIKIIAPIIKEQGEGGHIVNTSSMAGIVPLPGLSAYSASKFAIRGLSESLRMSLAPHGIGVSCLFPGGVNTNLVVIPEDDSSAPEGEEGKLVRELWGAMRAGVDPVDLGARVVEAIRDNAFFILTHREFLDEVQDRNRRMEDAFAEDIEVPDIRRRFENRRRETADALLGMKAKD